MSMLNKISELTYKISNMLYKISDMLYKILYKISDIIYITYLFWLINSKTACHSFP